MRKLTAGLLLGVGAAALVLLVAHAGWFHTVELQAYDWRMRRAADPASVHPSIVLVEINDTTLRDFAPLAGRWPWPRVVMSSLIDYLNRAPARVIAIDVAWLEEDRTAGFPYGGDTWSGAESDAALVESVRRAGNVILLADAVYEGVDGEVAHAPAAWSPRPYRLRPEIEERRSLVPPFQALTDSALALGHNFLALDSDGPARRMPPFVRVGDRYMPSLGMAAALEAAGVEPESVSLDGLTLRLGDRAVPLVPVPVPLPGEAGATRDQLTMLINYRAPATANGRRPYPSYELRHLIYSEEQILAGESPLVDPAVFRDRIVFLGLTASGLVDVFQTPFGAGGTMPGIQLHASMADSVLSNRFIRPAGDRARVSATVLTAALVGLLATILPFSLGVAATLGVMAGWTWWSVLAFRDGLWLDVTQPVAAMGLTLFGTTAYRYFVEDREKRTVKRLFGRYVSKDVYTQLLENPALAELGGRRREMTVLFSDIRGFTSVTERGDPEALVAQLNEYFSRMVAIVFAHRGTLDKFVGDMVMALFGAPLDDPDHAEHAASAAVEMVAELGRLNARWASEGRPQLDIGIGINSGEMIAGNIGSSAVMSYTVIGDNVNLGARLESLNKEYGTRIIISDATRSRLPGHFRLRPLGDVVVKGKSRPVAIFAIEAPAPLPEVPV